MLTKVNIKLLREAIIQASYTLDSKVSSVGSWMYLMAIAGTEKDSARMYLYSSNLGMARTLLKIPAEVTKAGYALIVPKFLTAILSSLPDDETIELGLSASGAKLQVKYGTLKSEIAVHADAQKASEVLQTIPFNAKPVTSISAISLVDIINRTLFCTASGGNTISDGPWLASLLLETGDGTIMATGTNRIIAGQAEIHDQLVKKDFSGAIHREALVALKSMLAKKKDEEVTITNATNEKTGTNELLFRFSDAVLGIRQLAKPYPNAKVAKVFIVPSNYQVATINRTQLLNVFSRLSAFAEQGSFTLTFADATVVLSTRGHGSIYQESVAKTEKTEGSVTIGLGLTDIVNALSVMKSEDVVVRYNTSNDHIHIQEGESNFRYVLSPAEVDWAKAKK